MQCKVAPCALKQRICFAGGSLWEWFWFKTMSHLSISHLGKTSRRNVTTTCCMALEYITDGALDHTAHGRMLCRQVWRAFHACDMRVGRLVFDNSIFFKLTQNSERSFLAPSSPKWCPTQSRPKITSPASFWSRLACITWPVSLYVSCQIASRTVRMEKWILMCKKALSHHKVNE